MLATDEGAARLGEVALVPHDSPVAQSGLLFYNTLFDENAASHLAIGSAYKFTLRGGVALRAETVERGDGWATIRIEVEDTGIGIAPHDLPKIVLPFGALNGRSATTSSRREGTGLGLPLSKSLVELHGGRLEIVSELGRGTIATVRLPVAEQAA